jgi:hypothetical protein
MPGDCGVMVLRADGGFSVARPALRPARAGLPFGVWMALAKATPIPGADEDAQGLLDASN